MLKRIAIILLVGITLGVSLAGAKTYSFNLTSPAVAGAAQLKAGEYRLKVEGTDVTLIDKAGNRIDVSPKVEEANRRFDYTSILTSTADGTSRIEAIQIGGSKTRIVFE